MSAREKREKLEMNNLEYVKWRKIWIAVDVVGFTLSILGIASFRLMDNHAMSAAFMICGIIILAIGVVIDHQKVTKVRNQYMVFTGYNKDDNSKAAVAARKAERERIDKLVAADKAAAAERAAKKAGK